MLLLNWLHVQSFQWQRREHVVSVQTVDRATVLRVKSVHGYNANVYTGPEWAV